MLAPDHAGKVANTLCVEYGYSPVELRGWAVLLQHLRFNSRKAIPFGIKPELAASCDGQVLPIEGKSNV